MKTGKLVVGAVVALFGLTMTLSVAMALMMSNIVTVHTTVVDEAGQLSIIDVDSGIGGMTDVPALGGSSVKGLTYDIGVRAQAAVDGGSVRLHYQIAAPSIAPADVTVTYWNGLTWATLTPTDNGATLDGIVPGTIALVAGYDGTMMFRIAFNTAGDYDTAFWLETA